jgi:Protein of unknown function (DUF3024)
VGRGYGFGLDPVPDRSTALCEDRRCVWSLYWRDRNSRFHAYDLVSPTARIEELLAEVDRDPTAIFWG